MAISQVVNLKEKYGQNGTNAGKVALIDYSMTPTSPSLSAWDIMVQQLLK